MPSRILKESICTSETIDKLSAEEERFFYRLLVQCDDFGRLDARPQILRAKCFPLKTDSLTNEDILRWLKTLVEVGLIQLYEVDGRPYLQVVTWQKHQRVRAKESKYPDPSEGRIISLTSDDICCHMTADARQMPANDGNCRQISTNDGNCRHMRPDSNIVISNSDSNIVISDADSSIVISDSDSDSGMKYKSMLEVCTNVQTSRPQSGQEVEINNHPPLAETGLQQSEKQVPSSEQENKPQEPQKLSEEKVTNASLIAELVKVYREIIPADKHQKGDYSFIGRMYNEFGYDRVLLAINELGYAVESGFVPERPLIYLRSLVAKVDSTQPNIRGSPKARDEGAGDRKPKKQNPKDVDTAEEVIRFLKQRGQYEEWRRWYESMFPHIYGAKPH